MGPKGIAVDRNGHIIVVDNKACCVFIFQSNGKLVTRFGARGSLDRQFAGTDIKHLRAAQGPYTAGYVPVCFLESIIRFVVAGLSMAKYARFFLYTFLPAFLMISDVCCEDCFLITNLIHKLFSHAGFACTPTLRITNRLGTSLQIFFRIYLKTYMAQCSSDNDGGFFFFFLSISLILLCI